jgi:lysophospholipase L1-like esterase
LFNAGGECNMPRIEPSQSSNTREIRWRVTKRVLVAIGLAPFLVLFFVLWFAIEDRLPLWFFYQAELIFLNLVEIAYGATLLVTAIAIPVLLIRLMGARRHGRSRLPMARGLLGCVSVLLALAAAEATTAIFKARADQQAVMPEVVKEDHASAAATWRFPPPENYTLPTDFPDGASDGDIDLVVLGESSAEGVPFRTWFSLGTILKWKLEQTMPGRTVRVRILARSGDTLERQHQALVRLDRRPELFIVYCGHNEFFSRLFSFRDLPHYFLDQRPNDWDRLVARVEHLSPFCGMIRESAEECRIALPPPMTPRELVDVPVYTAAEYTAILSDFRQRLQEIVVYARRVGALPILILPPGNDTDFEPNRSFLPADTPRQARESFRRAFLAARRLESTDPQASIKQYEELVQRQPGFAETHYRLAKLLEQAGAHERAYEHYIKARDQDGYPMRCLSSFQQIYRDVAGEQGCPLIDGQAYFHAIGRDGFLDDELFQDAMHPSFRGQIAIAQAVLSVLYTERTFGWPADRPLQPIDPAHCAAQFGLDREAWRETATWSKGFYSLTGHLRYDIRERSRRIDAAIAAADRIDAGVAPEALGLPNIGIPAPVPLIPADDGSGPPSVPALPAPNRATAGL